MRLRLLVSTSILLLGFQLSAGTNPNRNWQTARVEQIQRIETGGWHGLNEWVAVPYFIGSPFSF